MCKEFLFGIHIHQPVDNLKDAVDKAVEKCYAPLFETFAKYPEFKFSLHCSGWLFEVLKNEYSDVFDNIKRCSIEFFSAGYYEPVLAVIPREDRIAQIKKLNKFIEENFNTSPKGLWLTERVWSDGIVPEISQSGIEYTVVDDFHFKSVGIEPEGYYITEESALKLKIFPISKNLRYKIPFAKPEEALKAVENEKMPLMFDDGEKFGLWPGTYEWVYEKKWLEEFIEKALEKFNLMYFGEYINRFESGGIVYLPEVSYEEMQEWCLDTQTQIEYKKNRGFLSRGGVFKNFFRKYKESNHLHKRMLGISDRKNENLYKLQTNDVYWHGIFGGLYLPNLRDNAYRYLIENDCKEGIEVKDIDFDGYDEIKINEKDFICIFNRFGELIEFDDKKNRFNFLNTLKRRKEAYHFQKPKTSTKNVKTIHEISPEMGDLKKELFFDRYFRYSFIDHLVKNINLKSAKEDSFEDFFIKEYKKEGLTFENGQIKKSFVINGGIGFEIINKTEFTYVMEMNFHFADYRGLKISKEGIYDPYTKRNIVFGFKCSDMLYFPVETVSRDEKGFNKTVQGLSLFFVFESKEIKGEICLK
jgi:hypothetical protein